MTSVDRREIDDGADHVRDRIRGHPVDVLECREQEDSRRPIEAVGSVGVVVAVEGFGEGHVGGAEHEFALVDGVAVLADGGHHAVGFVLDVTDPVGFARGDDQMAVPAFDFAVQFVGLVDGELAREFDRAGRAVVETFFAVDRGDGSREESVGVFGGEKAAGTWFGGFVGVVGESVGDGAQERSHFGLEGCRRHVGGMN